MDQVDGVVPGLGGSVTREEDEGDVADTLPGPGIGVLQTERGLPGNDKVSLDMIPQ